MEHSISGIHHVTAISSDAQRTLDFYTGLLGLRLVKKTVNFDDPGTYHLYFGDELGRPGTILTFFPWEFAGRGSPGAGAVNVTSFSVHEESLGYWEERLLESGVPVEREGSRFEEEVLTFVDPDGLKLEIVAHATVPKPHPWTDATVPAEHSIRGFYSVTLSERGFEKTAQLLSSMGFRKVAESGNRFRFDVGEGGGGSRVDVLCLSEGRHAQMGAGSVHHVAFRVRNDDAQLAWQKRLVDADLDVTPVRDRVYFRSIYFFEPGGILFELATDPPGFAIDEPEDSLGEALMLPPWLESKRKQIEKILPIIEIHRPARGLKPAGGLR
jgi:glyoxalase family protein